MIEWTKTKPTVAGWYWVIYYGYEHTEAVFLTDVDTVYAIQALGATVCTEDIESGIEMWSAEMINQPAHPYGWA